MAKLSSNILQQHYTYLIVHKTTRKRYIGVRTDYHQGTPDVLTGKYLTSSSDKSFIKELKAHPECFFIRVLKFFSTREDADKEEIKLHQKYNVDINPLYYNKVKSNPAVFYPLKPAGEGNPSNKPVAAYYNGILIKEFCSSLEAERQTSISAGGISRCARGERNNSGLYDSQRNIFLKSNNYNSQTKLPEHLHRINWFFIDSHGNIITYIQKETSKTKESKKYNMFKPVRAYLSNGSQVGDFLYCKLASVQTNISENILGKCLIGRCRYAGIYNPSTAHFMGYKLNNKLPEGYYWIYLMSARKPTPLGVG